MAQKSYIVRRETADNGPNGSEYSYVRTTWPIPGEKIFHGKFTERTIYGGQYDKDEIRIMVPVGEVTSEVFTGNGSDVEEF